MKDLLKRNILRKSAAMISAAVVSLVMYLFILLGCISKAPGIETLQWVSIEQAGQNAKISIGYFGLCTNLLPGGDSICFPSSKPPRLSNIPLQHPLLLAARSLQKNALYPIPAIASCLFFLSIAFYFIVDRKTARNENSAKLETLKTLRKLTATMLGISAAVGIAGALASMSAASALHAASAGLAWNMAVKPGMSMMFLLWIAAGIQTCVAAYVGAGMLVVLKQGDDVEALPPPSSIEIKNPAM